MVGGTGPSVSDIFPDRCRKEHGLLVDVTDGTAAKPFRIQVPQVDPIDAHGPRVYIVETLQEGGYKFTYLSKGFTIYLSTWRFGQILPTVDLPPPLAPTNATIFPAGTARLKFWSTA